MVHRRTNPATRRVARYALLVPAQKDPNLTWYSRDDRNPPPPHGPHETRHRIRGQHARALHGALRRASEPAQRESSPTPLCGTNHPTDSRLLHSRELRSPTLESRGAMPILSCEASEAAPPACRRRVQADSMAVTPTTREERQGIHLRSTATATHPRTRL